MKDAALEAALREALSADSIHGALRTAAVFRPPLGEADALESAVAELHGRVLSAYQSATTAVSKSRQSKEAYDGDPAPPAPPDAYNVRVNFTDQGPEPSPNKDVGGCRGPSEGDCEADVHALPKAAKDGPDAFGTGFFGGP